MKTVAVIGASTNRAKFGNKAVRAFVAAGYRVVPVTPRHAEVEGLTAYASVADVAGPIDMATVYVPPSVGETLVAGLADKGVGEVWLNPGAESPELVRQLTAAGLRPIQACSIVGIGLSPAQF